MTRVLLALLLCGCSSIDDFVDERVEPQHVEVTTTVAPLASGDVVAPCDGHVTDGGSDGPGLYVFASARSARGWTCHATNETREPLTLTCWVECQRRGGGW